MTAIAGPICPACEIATHLTSMSAVISNRPDLAAKPIWLCQQCGARVGCHPGTHEPLGTPANATLRAAREKVHDVFDPLWKALKNERARSIAYSWLAGGLGLSLDQCHIGRFSLEDCRRAREFLKRQTQDSLAHYVEYAMRQPLRHRFKI